jgi:hypothetical protein
MSESLRPSCAPTSGDAIREQLRQNMLRGDYRGLEVRELQRLRHTVPNEFRDSKDLEQQISFYVLEAIDLYDTTKNTKFSTWLVQHLRLRCGNYQQYLWIRKTAPLASGRQSSRRFRDTEDNFSSPSYEQHQLLTVTCHPSASLEIQELISALSAESRDYLRRLFDYEDQEALVAAFKSLHFRSKVSKATGMSATQVELLRDEIQQQLPKHLLSVA